ncbi:MAG: MFS transporter [Candidatus Eremiobacteraeota bacterium]|nr:MFS transporter [Candidatus Eremiobacteraeota bacterium]MBV9647186.1 MFS transporter [Candidatus Eremiobacteraeota bacterium]
MEIFAPLRELSPSQWRTFIAAFLGWCLDAFDFFLVTFVITAIADDFKLPIPTVLFAVTIALMFRPLGALLFGMLADRYGRRGPLMLSIALYSLFELLSGFSPNFTALIVLRALYGIAMGGEWGVGAAIALETLPAKARGVASGIIQQGYATGYLLAALVFGTLFQYIGWRGMFFVGVLPALLVFYIRRGVEESPAWRSGQSRSLGMGVGLWQSIRQHPILFVYAILLMAAFNFMSHGSQDLYPTFLLKQHGFNPQSVRNVTVLMNVGAIVGGTLIGALSQRIGRRMAIMACCGLGAVLVPFWSGAQTAATLALGAFALQFFVQGAWGVVPAQLNELSPAEARGTFPGFTYQLGNLITAYAAQWEAAFATKRFPLPPPQGANYGHAMALAMVAVFAAVFILALVGPERRGVDFMAKRAATVSA